MSETQAIGLPARDWVSEERRIRRRYAADRRLQAYGIIAISLAVGLLGILARTVADRIAQWDHGRGFAAIRLDWLERAANLGEPIRVSVGGQERAGRFDGLDEAGHLVLTLADGTTQRISAGDVFPSATPARRAERTEAPISVGGV